MLLSASWYVVVQNKKGLLIIESKSAIKLIEVDSGWILHHEIPESGRPSATAATTAFLLL
jgi:hypothetical protein